MTKEELEKKAKELKQHCIENEVACVIAIDFDNKILSLGAGNGNSIANILKAIAKDFRNIVMYNQ
jgi:hypothetical protein